MYNTSQTPPIPEDHPYSLEYTRAKGDVVVATSMLLGTNIVKQWEEGGYLWRIDAIDPKMVGASLRKYELFVDGSPAGGGRYHASINDAEERAAYCSQGAMHRQIGYLWGLVHQYRQELRELTSRGNPKGYGNE